MTDSPPVGRSTVASLRALVHRIPFFGGLAARAYRRFAGSGPEPFPGSAEYWDRRYAGGGDSGVGSYDFFAEFKAEVLNGFVAAHGVRTVIEFGCGDGNQLSLASYPSYLGFDVSSAAIARCRAMFGADATRSFRLMNEYDGERAELVLSLDVIYHLVEDDVFDDYMRTMFGASDRHAIIYSSNSDDNRGNAGTHVRHRQFTRWIEEEIPAWRLVSHIPNRYPHRGDYRTGSRADFYVYEKSG